MNGFATQFLYTASLITTNHVIPAPIYIGINSSRNPVKHWIPGQARNDNPVKIYVVMYKWAIRIV